MPSSHPGRNQPLGTTGRGGAGSGRNRPWAGLLLFGLALGILWSCQAETRISRPAEEAGDCRIETEALEFGQVLIGESRLDTLRIRNIGSGDLSGRVRGGCEGFVVAEGEGRFQLASGQRLEVVVRFEPTRSGSLHCEIDLGTGCRAVSGMGIGLIPAQCLVAPAQVEFGDVPADIGGIDEVREFTVTNGGQAPLSLDPSVDCDGFALRPNGPMTLEGGQSQRFEVRFTPTEVRDYVCVIELGAECGDGVACLGRGIRAPVCEVSTGEIDLGLLEFGTSETAEFTLTNTADGFVLGSVGLGDACDGFQILEGSGQFALGGGERRTVSVGFAADEVGPQSCTIETGTECADVVVRAEVDDPPLCSLDVEEVNLGAVILGETAVGTVTIRNAGGSRLKGEAELVAGCSDFALTAGAGRFILARGEEREISFRYSAQVEGLAECSIRFAPDCPALTVRAEAVRPPLCELDRTEIDFGIVEVGSGNEDSFTIRNSGGLPFSGTVTLTDTPGPGCSGYSLLEGAGDFTLKPDEARFVRVRFEPTGSGSVPCQVSVGDLCPPVELSGVGQLPPECFVSVAELDFETVILGASLVRTVRVENVGEGLLTGQASLSGAGFSLLTGSGDFALGAGQRVDLNVEFRPDTAGPYSGSIDLGSECPPVILSGTGVEPAACLVSTSEIDFGSLDLGTEVRRTVTVENKGGSSLELAVALESCDEGFSIVSGGGSAQLPGGESLEVELSFIPSVSGPALCTLVVGKECDSVSLSGRGLLPATCVLSQESLDFGTVIVGQSAEAVLEIGNTGESVLEGEVSLPSCSEFSVVAGSGPYVLAENETRSVTVRYSPTSEGAAACELQLGHPNCETVPVSGSGQDPSVCVVSESAIDFGELTVGDAESAEFTIRNEGGGTVSGVVSFDTGCGGFFLVAGGGSFSLGPEQERLVRVTFQPSSAGNYDCTVLLGTDCPSVSFSGSADVPPACDVSEMELDFGTLEIGESAERSFTVENTGGSILEGSVSLGSGCSEFSLTNGAGNFSLAAGQSRNVTVRFAPVNSGAETCFIELGSSSCPSIEAQGEGEALPFCQLTPSSLDFGLVTASSSGSNFRDLSFKVKNSGGGTLSGTIFEACGAYSIQSGGGSFSLEAGEERTVVVRFRPTSRGNSNCTVFVASSPSTCEVDCEGTGGTGFSEHVRPLLSSCVGGGCHTSVIQDYSWVVARVDTGTPLNSLFLRKPANVVSHSGGLRPGWQWLTGANHILAREWIEEGIAP